MDNVERTTVQVERLICKGSFEVLPSVDKEVDGVVEDVRGITVTETACSLCGSRGGRSGSVRRIPEARTGTTVTNSARVCRSVSGHRGRSGGLEADTVRLPSTYTV